MCCADTYLVLEKVIPGLATERIADDEFKDIKRDVGNDTENPDHSSPSPSTALDSGKSPVCVYSNNCSQLTWTITEESQDKMT